jgi:hypothetical protein
MLEGWHGNVRSRECDGIRGGVALIRGHDCRSQEEVNGELGRYPGDWDQPQGSVWNPG